MEDRTRGRKHIRPQLGMDAVGGDDNVGFDGGPFANDTLATSPTCSKAMPRWPVCTTPAGRALARKSTKSARCIPKVAFQPAESVTCTGAMGAPSWRKYCEPVPTLAPHFSTAGPKSDPLQLAHAVRCQEHAGPDLAEGRGLLIDRHAEPVGEQRVRREQAADAAADDHDVGPFLQHLISLARAAECVAFHPHVYCTMRPAKKTTRRERRAKSGDVGRKQGG